MVDCGAQFVRSEGVGALSKGAGANILRVSVARLLCAVLVPKKFLLTSSPFLRRGCPRCRCPVPHDQMQVLLFGRKLPAGSGSAMFDLDQISSRHPLALSLSRRRLMMSPPPLSREHAIPYVCPPLRRSLPVVILQLS